MPDALVEPFRPFLAALRPGRPVAVLAHSDADGLSAAAVLSRGLARAGHAAPVELTLKGESAWSPEVAERLRLLAPQALIVADLGCRPVPILPGVPTMFIDHHRPDGVPDGAALITGYGTDPTPSSSLIAYECAALAADVSDLDWIAALGIVGDLGEKAPFPLLAAAKKRHTAARLKEATALINAPRRAGSGDARPALKLLLEGDGPRVVTHGDSPEASALRAAKSEVAEAFAVAKKAAPRVQGDVALIRTHSPCQIHPMVAQVWRARLARNVVVVANTGYLPGRVNFSVRSATGVNLIDFLRDRAPADAGDWFARGHDQATGGSLSHAAWNEFVRKLGFGPESEVRP